MSVLEKQRQLVEKFGALPDRQERLSAIVDWARQRARLPAEMRTAAHRVTGCVSPVWVATEWKDGRIVIRCDAESPVVKGLVALLCEVYDGGSAKDVAAFETALFEELDLMRDLSATRRNGLAAVRWKLRELAAAHARNG